MPSMAAPQQLDLHLSVTPRQAAEEEKKKKHGGARVGAGRKLAKNKRRNVPHRARPIHKERLPSLVTLRAVGPLPSFRHETVLRLFKKLVADQCRQHGDAFRI